ncbi:MAG: hypothetical protein KAH17_07370 [Bacteroidales bacterium]|nr:hypothetical protein [Bacteroidales bacterium]
MNRRLIITLILISVPIFLMAQRQGRRFDEYFEKYKSERVAYLTQKLDLEVTEAEKFWPIYNEYQNKRETMMKKGRPQWRRLDMDSLSDTQMKEMMDAKIQGDLKMAKLALEYHKKFQAILPIKKVFILHHAEQSFMSHMIQRLRESGEFGTRPDKRRGTTGRK